MSKSAHVRVVRLFWFDGSLPTFENTKELKEWYEAVGRMVTYGMHDTDGKDDTVQYVSGSFCTDQREFTFAFYPTLIAQPEKYKDGGAKYIGSPLAKVDQFHDEMREYGNHAYVLGAVKSCIDGKWGFHS